MPGLGVIRSLGLATMALVLGVGVGLVQDQGRAGETGAQEATATRPATGGPARRASQFREGYFPNVVLRTHEGKAVRFYDDLLKDRLVVINMVYTNCADGQCPLFTANLARVQQLLKDRVGRDIFMYSITLDPEHDTPEVLRKYARSYGVGPGWLFLTGRPEDIELLRRKLGYVDPNPKLDAIKATHIGMVRYGNERFERWGAVPGGARPEWIARTILWGVDTAKKETRLENPPGTGKLALGIPSSPRDARPLP